MQTLDDMRNLHLLSDEQHAEISDWLFTAKTPEAILQMPAHLWRALELASVLMGFDAQITQAPLLESGFN